MAEFVVAFSTVDTEKEAQNISKKLVESKLAACVNILPGVRSVYEWKGELCEEMEFLLVIKTESSRVEALKATLEAVHPYEVPEFVVLPIIDGLPDYLNWVLESTK